MPYLAWDRLARSVHRVRSEQNASVDLQLLHSREQALAFVHGRVTRATDPDYAFGGSAQALDDRRGVEVAVGDEETARRERTRDFVGRVALESERERWRARRAGPRTVQRDSVHLGERIPQAREERFAA